MLAQLKRDVLMLEASDCTKAAPLLDDNADLDLILLDLSAPDGDGFSALARLREHCPGTDVICLAASSEMRDITKALELGAAGYIPKTTSLEVMLGALKLVFSGGVYIPPEILEGKPPPKGEPGCGGSL